tara:strand:+ start:7136 stop:7891 length:756 start_codon:yes stop_codon:yes gene_type:complete
MNILFNNIYYIMTSKITIILSYYNQPKEVLIRHIDNWKQYTNINEFTFFIIDDCSKIPANKLLEDYDLSNLDLHLYRVEEDLYCNIAGVRNLGANECKTPYMVILDMDTIINNEMSNKLLLLAETNIDKNNVFKFNRLVPTPDGLSFQTKHKKHNKPHPAICLIRKKDYWDIGGCEEDLVGNYGQTDPSFWYKSNGKVNIITCKTINLLYYIDGESDIQRNREHNLNMFDIKKKNNNWSTDYIRFKWSKII